MPDSTLKAAIQEAYIFAVDKPVLHTLEFLHPAFESSQGVKTAIRVVMDLQDLTARLEADAPLNPSQYVTFTRMAFTITLPEKGDSAAPEAVIEMDNVGRELMQWLDIANVSTDPIVMIYRAYLYDDLTQPQTDPRYEFEISTIRTNNKTVQATATVRTNLDGRAFPNRVLTVVECPGLTQ